MDVLVHVDTYNRMVVRAYIQYMYTYSVAAFLVLPQDSEKTWMYANGAQPKRKMWELKRPCFSLATLDLGRQ